MPTLEITQELLDKLNSGESITIKPPKKKIVLEKLEYAFTNDAVSSSTSIRFREKFGRHRNTKEACEIARERMNKTNRLSQLAHQLGGEREFVDEETNWYIYLFKGKWKVSSYSSLNCVELVYMTEECAEQICEILNNGEFEL